MQMKWHHEGNAFRLFLGILLHKGLRKPANIIHRKVANLHKVCPRIIVKFLYGIVHILLRRGDAAVGGAVFHILQPADDFGRYTLLGVYSPYAYQYPYYGIECMMYCQMDKKDGLDGLEVILMQNKNILIIL